MSYGHLVQLHEFVGGGLNGGVELQDGLEEVTRLASEFWADSEPWARDISVREVRELAADLNVVGVNRGREAIGAFLLFLTERHPDLVVGLRGMGDDFEDLWSDCYTGGQHYDSVDDAVAAWKRAAAARKRAAARRGRRSGSPEQRQKSRKHR